MLRDHVAQFGQVIMRFKSRCTSSWSACAVYPDLSCREFVVPVEYINKTIGVELEAKQIANILGKMQHVATVVDGNLIHVRVPPTRSDILHPCDVMEVNILALAIIPFVGTSHGAQHRSEVMGKLRHTRGAHAAMSSMKFIIHILQFKTAQGF